LTGVAYRAVAIPGDGVGPEVLAAGRAVLDAAGERFGFQIAWDEILMGGVAIDEYGVAIRDEDIARCRAADAVFLGAVGGPRWDDPNAKVRPEQGLLALRKALTLYGNLRPVSVDPALAASAPLRPDLLEGVDLLIVRELTGGLYFGRPSEERGEPGSRSAVDTLTYSESENQSSPHAADYTRAFSKKKWNKVPFCQADIRAQATSVMRVGDSTPIRAAMAESPAGRPTSRGLRPTRIRTNINTRASMNAVI